MRQRNTSGTSIPEFAVSFFILILLTFFPLLDMIGLAATYFCALILVDQQSHEASMLPYQLAQSKQGPILEALPKAWLSSSLGNFANVEAGNINTQVDYTDGISDEFGYDYKQVQITTTLLVKPFIFCPFPLQVPGLNTAVPLILRSQRFMEDPTNAPAA